MGIENREAMTPPWGLRSTKPFSLRLVGTETMPSSSELTSAEAKPPLFELFYTVVTALSWELIVTEAMLPSQRHKDHAFSTGTGR